MESIKVLVEQMLNLVQHHHNGQSDAYEIIGKLEQLKAYFLTEAMHNSMFNGASLFQSIPQMGQPTQATPPIETMGQQATVPTQPTPPIETMGQQATVPTQPTPPIEAMGQQATVLDQLVMQQPQALGNVVQTTPTYIQNQALIPQPAGPFAPNPRLWQLVDEGSFEAVGQPILWFSTSIGSIKSRNMLDIPSEDLDAFIAQSPPASFAQSSLFTGMTLPITLYSRKLDSLFRGAPGLLVHKGGSNAYIYWPSVGKFFREPSVVDVWYHWKVLGPRYMLIIRVDVQDPSRAGPSGTAPSGAGASVQRKARADQQGAGPSGAGPSGAGPSVQRSASKRSRQGGV